MTGDESNSLNNGLGPNVGDSIESEDLLPNDENSVENDGLESISGNNMESEEVLPSDEGNNQNDELGPIDSDNIESDTQLSDETNDEIEVLRPEILSGDSIESEVQQPSHEINFHNNV